MMRFVFAMVASALFVGCDRESATEDAAETAEVKLFEKGKGLRLPPETCQMIGIETVDIDEKPFVQTVKFAAQVYELGDNTRARALASLAPERAKKLSVETAVAVSPADSTNAHRGTVTRVESLGTRSEALIEFNARPGEVPVGSFVDVTVTTGTNTAVAVPNSALIRGSDGVFVYVVNGEHFTRTRVKTGATAGEYTEVLEGLYAGDAVAAKAAEPMWMIELYALKGGTPCCPVPKKNTAR